MSSKAAKPQLPELRFPEFRSAAAWSSTRLEECSTPVTERVKDKVLTPISISAGSGFVPQAEKFGRDISGNQYGLYTHVRKGDFVYNKGNSLKYPQGCVYQLKEWGEIAAPNVFICFRLKRGYSPRFYEYCFEKNLHGLQLTKHITSGARSNGLLNISKDAFFGIELPLPTFPEQQRIADCLSSIDDLIVAQGRKIEALGAHKQGLMQQLFPVGGEAVPRLRFPQFQGGREWKKKRVGDVFKVTRGEVLSMTLVAETKSEKLPYPVYSSQTKRNGLAGFYSEFLYEDAITWTTDGANAGDVNYRPGSFYCTNVCGVLLSNEGQANACTAAIINSVARGYVSYVGNPKLMNGVMSGIVVFLPEIQEQKIIAEFLSSIDIIVAASLEKLEKLQRLKKGVMQWLFPATVEVEV